MTTLRAVIVDHDAQDRERYHAILARVGIDAVASASGAEALARLRDPAGQVGAVILALDLRGRPGATELLTLLRREWPDLPVLVLGSVVNMAVAALTYKLGAHDFVEKTHARDRLGPATLRALAGTTQGKLEEALRKSLTGNAPAFLTMLRTLATAIPQTEEPVLLIGENGTGKELLARAIHDLGGERGTPLVAVNVAALAPSLIEGELFGREKGAFTGADKQQPGLFEQCGRGTLFLDEIGELELPLQPKLLRAVQERTFQRVGGRADLIFAGRLVCATNRDLPADVEAGRFRRDLYNRIAGFEIRVPALRDRGDDRWLLIDHFLGRHRPGRKPKLAPETRELLAEYPFPGNVRELEKIVKRAVASCRGDEILPFDLPVEVMDLRQPAVSAPDLDALRWPEALFGLKQRQALYQIEQTFNRVYLPRKLEEAGGKKERAADLAGLDSKTFRNKWKNAGLGPDGTAEAQEP